MYLVMDVGNSNIKFGLFEGRELLNSWRVYTLTDKTSDEYGIELCSFFNYIKREPTDVEGVLISSVLPSINHTMERMCELYLKKRAVFVHPELTGIHINYDDPRKLGTDRIANSIAAYELYGGPCIVIDFGTATTFNVVDKHGNFVGGVICPGIIISRDALVKNAAQLPAFDLTRPDSIIGTNTMVSMQSGIIYGYVGLVDYIVSRIKKEINEPNCRVIATGGTARLLEGESKSIDTINGLLTLEGLSILYLRNSWHDVDI